MGKHLVLIGGGHAHMVTLKSLHQFIDKGHKVTVIGPSDHHYYSGMGPGMLGMTYKPSEIRFAIKHIVEKQGGTFLKDSVSHVDPDQKKVYTLAGKVIDYDTLSFNAGSYVPLDSLPVSGENIYPVKPIEKLVEAREKLKILFGQKKAVISIVGGGPSAAEISGNVYQLAKHINSSEPIIRIFAGKKFMARFEKKFREKAVSSLKRKHIQIIEGDYVKRITENKMILESGETFKTDFVFLALGVKPSGIINDSGLPVGPDNGLLVNRHLQSIKYPDIFGGGDCIYFKDAPLDKAGVYAVRQNPVLFNNLLSSLEGGMLETFKPGPEYLMIFNLGDGEGLFKKKKIIFSGKMAFFIKDYIDQKFMKKFQAIEQE